MENRKIQFLQNSLFFRGISEDSIRKLSAITKVIDLEKKNFVFLEGDSGSRIFICMGGTIQLFKSTYDGKEIGIKVIQPGEIFAEVILFEQDHYPVSARTLSACQLMAIYRDDFLHLLEFPDFRNDFIRMLMIKQKYLANRIKYLTSEDVEQRLRMFLQDQYGRVEKINLQMSKKDVAAAIGIVPETLSRLLKKITAEGKMEWVGRQVKIHPSFWKAG